MNTTRDKYTEPQTFVAEVNMEGFICASATNMMLRPEVDEYVNKGEFEMVLD